MVQSEGHNIYRQIYYMFYKRFHSSKRDIRSILFGFGLPFLFVAGSIVMMWSLGFFRSPNSSLPSIYSRVLRVPTQTVTPFSLTANNLLGAYYQKFLYNTNYDLENLIPLSSEGTSSFVGASAPSLSALDEVIKNSLTPNRRSAAFPGAIFSSSTPYNNNFEYTILYNENTLFTVPIGISVVSDCLMRMISNGTVGLQAENAPFRHILTYKENVILQEFFLNPLNWPIISYFAIFMVATYSIFPSLVASNLVQEREFQVKNLLIISGLRRSAYWISLTLWDFVQSLVIIGFNALLLRFVFPTVINTYNAWVIFILLAFTSTALISTSYLYSFMFSRHNLAFVIIFLIHFGLGAGLMAGFVQGAYAVMYAPQDLMGQQTMQSIFYVGGLLSPTFNFAKSLLEILHYPLPYSDQPLFNLNRIGFPFLMLIVQTFLSFGLVLLIEYRYLWKYYTKKLWRGVRSLSIFKRNRDSQQDNLKDINLDSDVEEEAKRVLSMEAGPSTSRDVIQAANLSKVYRKNLVAVHSLSFGVPNGQCFGLLGMNGAGKSTTLGMLSGEINPTSGNIQLNGFNLANQRELALKFFGWCPQNDAIDLHLTLREHLTLFANIKGINRQLVSKTVEAFITMLDLGSIADHPIYSYSGGNKRKVSVALALIGFPPILLLDEVSTGVDPLGRRFLWNIINVMVQSKAIILTTHTMEEVEALCSRLTILSHGEMKCLGSPQHLKNKYSSGYVVQIKPFGSRMETRYEIDQKIKATFPHAFFNHPFSPLRLDPLNQNNQDNEKNNKNNNTIEVELYNSSMGIHEGIVLTYSIPVSEDVTPAHIFEFFQKLDPFKVEDFSISQTSIEHVFLKIAK
eukprot:TRINITY_DN15382_c0_g1_i1.p1 TRINITY_DN15382_c0_g1~~TRINITY_DN15382_c0_g1_i1.p1  ORF type:complete len:935 (-),score=191.03 TRINITY_DN15382_c0_g1_i1:10-2565(-)